MKIKEGFMMRKVAGMHVAVPIGEAVKEFNGMIQLNETSAFLWNQLLEETTKEQVIQAVTETYEVDREKAGMDLEKFLGKLREAGALEE